MRQRWLTVLLVPAVLIAACSSGGGTEVVSGGRATEDEAPGTATTSVIGSSPTEAPTTTTTPAATTTAPTTATTLLPTTATTRPAPTTTVPAPTTTTTFPPNAVRLTLANDMPVPVDISIAPGKFHLAAGQRVGPLAYVTPDHGNDVYTVVISGTDCGAGSAGGYFHGGAGRSATMRIVPETRTAGCEAAGPGVPNFTVAFERDGWVGVDG